MVGEVDAHLKGMVKLECIDDWVGRVVLHLYCILFVPEAVTNLFSLLKVGKVGKENYIVRQAKWMAYFNGSCI